MQTERKDFLTHKFIKTKKIGKILIVTMNRPEVHNAMHPPMHAEMEKVWNDYSTNPDLWVAILTGAGSKAFSAGNDLKYAASNKNTSMCKTGFAGLSERFVVKKQFFEQ